MVVTGLNIFALYLNSLLLSGWWRLSRHYRASSPFEGVRFQMRTGHLGWSNYGNCLTVGVNGDGLRLSVFFLFRPGHPPLFISWSDVNVTFTKGWIFRYCDLRFSQAPHLRLRVFESLGREIAAAANQSWDASDALAEGEATEAAKPVE